MEKERLRTLNKSMVNLLLNDDQTKPTAAVECDEHHSDSNDSHGSGER